MIYFTKYAEKKFDILNKYKVYYTKEEIKDCINKPDKTGTKNSYLTYEKDGIKVLCKKIQGAKKVITFYPF